MNDKKTIWEDLNELPRNEGAENESWQNIEKNLSKPKVGINVLTGFVTMALVFLIFTLLTTSRNQEMATQQAAEQSLEVVYFLNDSKFDQFDVKPSTWYTFVQKNTDAQQLKELERVLKANTKADAPKPTFEYTEGVYVDLMLSYQDALKRYKVLVTKPGYLYDVDTKEWLYNEHPNFVDIVDQVTREQYTSWLPLFILFNAIFTIVVEKVLKRKYKVEKIIYGGDHPVAKYTIYGNIFLMGAFLMVLIFRQFVIHTIWIVAVFAILLTINMMIESKYGKNKAAIYMLISSTIGLLLFILFFSLNV